MLDDQDLLRIFSWPNTSEVEHQNASPLYKHDALLARVEALIGEKRAWAPITGGTKRTESSQKLSQWFEKQNSKCLRLQRQIPVTGPPLLDLTDFPLDENNPDKHIVSTAKNIVYLIDRCEDFIRIYQEAFPDREFPQGLLDPSIGVFLYVTNSVTSTGRAFSGDPFTGQITAYSKIFGTDINNSAERNIVAYYPHQLYSQIFNSSGILNDNKGLRVLGRLTTLLIMTGGVLVKPSSGEVIDA